MNKFLTAVLLGAYSGTIIGANWALQQFGFVSLLGLAVPAGVFFAGFALGIRDALHETAGKFAVLGAIMLGATISWLVEPSFAVASGAAFLFSELADMAVYSPLRKRNWALAVVLSNIAGSVVDSALFLWLAFATTSGVVDLTLGKWLMILPSIGVVAVFRHAVSR